MTDRERELDDLRSKLADRRRYWVPRVATNAKWSKSRRGWLLGDISGAAGKSLLIYADPKHRTHIDFNGEQWKGDDLDLIRALCRMPDLPSTIEHAAGLIAFHLEAWGKKPAVVRTRVFEYRDEAGKVLFEVVRQELEGGRKRIWQRRTDASGRTVNSLGDVRRVPYRLRELTAAIDRGETIFVAEGEAKVSLLITWGLAATCNVMGAGNWKPRYAEPFKRRKVPVVILPDNDEAGRKHARQVAESLHPVAESVKITDLPKLKPKGDIVDWAAAGGTKELLLAFVEKTSPWEPPVDPAPEPEPAAETREPQPPEPQPQSDEAVDAEQDKAPMFSEEDLALRFAAKHAIELRFVAAWGLWFFWRGGRWETDDTLRAFHLSRRICRGAAEQCGKAKLKVILASARTEAAVERIARSDRRLAATVAQWDVDPLLVNAPAGTVDLRTGKIRAHRVGDFITKIAAASPGGEYPMWLAFLDRTMAGDRELVAYLKRVCGYCLTGITSAHVLFFIYGTGANGKSVFLNTISGIMDDYAVTAPPEVFMASHTDRHPTELARLRGARLVTASETEIGRRWAESRIKQLTGGDKITARFMRQEFFEFVPQFKLMISGNHKPRISRVDEAIRRRIHLIPFIITIPPDERDPDLAEKLKAEWSGILKWMIEGCLEWQRVGLAPPEAVRRATDEYLASEDVIATWLEECCTISLRGFAKSADLFASWKAWAERNGEYVGTLKALSQELVKQGFEIDRGGHHRDRGFRGLTIRPEGAPDQGALTDRWEH